MRNAESGNLNVIIDIDDDAPLQWHGDDCFTIGDAGVERQNGRLRFYSISGENAYDVDDEVFLQALPGGRVSVGDDSAFDSLAVRTDDFQIALGSLIRRPILEIVEAISGGDWNEPGVPASLYRDFARSYPGADDEAELSALVKTHMPAFHLQMRVRRPAGGNQDDFRAVTIQAIPQRLLDAGLTPLVWERLLAAPRATMKTAVRFLGDVLNGEGRYVEDFNAIAAAVDWNLRTKAAEAVFYHLRGETLRPHAPVLLAAAKRPAKSGLQVPDCIFSLDIGLELRRRRLGPASLPPPGTAFEDLLEIADAEHRHRADAEAEARRNSAQTPAGAIQSLLNGDRPDLFRRFPKDRQEAFRRLLQPSDARSRSADSGSQQNESEFPCTT